MKLRFQKRKEARCKSNYEKIWKRKLGLANILIRIDARKEYFFRHIPVPEYAFRNIPVSDYVFSEYYQNLMVDFCVDSVCVLNNS